MRGSVDLRTALAPPLLVFWVTMQVVGWGLVWWGYRTGIHTIDSLLESIYYAGVGFFTVGFGDVVPVGSDLASSCSSRPSSG